jgi:hypothetical protein
MANSKLGVAGSIRPLLVGGLSIGAIRASAAAGLVITTGSSRLAIGSPVSAPRS